MKLELVPEHVHLHLEIFYTQRAERLKFLTLDTVLANAPHNFWAIQDTDAPRIVAHLVEEYLVSFEQWWSRLIQDANFCLRAIQLRAQLTTSLYAYQNQLAHAQNRLTLDFINRYCRADYAIDWAKLLHFNSGAS